MTIRIRGGCQGYEYIRAMALQEPSKVKKKGAERKRNSLRKNDRKGFHKSLSTSTSLQPANKKTITSMIPSLKANNKQLAVALDTARRKIRRSEESIITLQQERQELLEKNVKSEKLIQSLQVHLPKAELLLHDADDKIAAAKQSVTAAKEMLLEYSMKESSSDRGTTISAATMSEELNVEQCLPFNPVMASTPQHSPISSPTRVKEDVNIHDNVVGGSFDMVNITDQLQHSPDLSEVDMLSVLSPLQDVPSISPIIEAEKGPSFKASKTIKPMIGRTPRPKRHCTELATSYAEDDLMRKLYGEELSDDIPAAKQKKSKNVLKKKPALSNITNVISTQ